MVILLHLCTNTGGNVEEEYAIVSFWKLDGLNHETSSTICSLLALAFKQAFVIYNIRDNHLVITEVVIASSEEDAKKASIQYCLETLRNSLQASIHRPVKTVCIKIADMTARKKRDAIDVTVDEILTVYSRESILPNQN